MQAGFATEHGYTSVPVRTDEAEFNLPELMRLRGYDDSTCPLINETRFYDLQMPDRIALKQALNTTLIRWLNEKQGELEFDQESGIITEVAPPLVITLADQIALVNELLQRHLENRYLPYPQMTGEDWTLLKAF